jgi:hypothetical protein
MPQGLEPKDTKLQADNARKAFDQKFERFARLSARAS